MNSVARPRLLTPADYLAGERDGELRHEYEDGHIRAMTGASRAHNSISGNVYVPLHAHLRGSPCRAYISDVKVHVRWDAGECFFYPDVLASYEGGNDAYLVESPTLIVEVLSPSTERRDRAEKAFAYRRLASLEEYVLIAQDVRRVEIYRRATGWELERINDAFPSPIRFDSVGLTLKLDDIYDGLDLPADPTVL